MKKIHLNEELKRVDWGWFCFLEWDGWLRKLGQPFVKANWPYSNDEKEEQKSGETNP